MINNKYSIFSKFLKYLLPYRFKWIGVIFLSVFGMLVTLVNPYLTKIVVDDVIIKKDLKTFFILALIGGSIFLITGILDGLKRYIGRDISLRVKLDLNRDVFEKINGLHFKWFQDKSAGEHVYKISYDVDRVENLITTVPPEAVSLFPKLVFVIFIIFYLNWKMALFSLCFVPVLYLQPYYFIKKREKLWKIFIKNSEGIFKALHEMFSRVYFIKAFGKEDSFLAKYLRRLKENFKVELDNTKIDAFSSCAASTMNKIVMGFIAFFGGYLVIKGKMTLGSLAAIMVYLGQLVGMQESFIGFFQRVTLGLVSCERINEILNKKSEIAEKKDAKEFIFNKGSIVFDRVSFGYSEGRHILKDMSFRIEGRHISIVASSGAGKTTLLNLIARLYDAWEGKISIDGMDIKDLKLKSLKGQIGMALQESFLFDDTAANNILYGKEDASEAEIIEASKLTLSHDFIKGLPDGYDSVIGENACKISEGQKQKIAIARALIKKPKILILDEAMSSMDSLSEEAILFNIKESFKDMTLITVSHRLSTVLKADLAYFLKGPNDMVIGEPQELLEKDKEFYSLFKSQIANPVLNQTA